jgi:hypothetical protein
MDGKQRSVAVRTCCILSLTLLLCTDILASKALADNATHDLAFFEWLGQIAEAESLGVDIDAMLEQRERKMSETVEAQPEMESSQ